MANPAESEKRESRLFRQASLALSQAAPALGIYAAIRLTGMLAVAVHAWTQGQHLGAVLGNAWDAKWYARIATDGYGTVLRASGFVYDDRAFFPLLPGLERVLSTVLPVTAGEAGILVASLSALAAAWGLFAVGTVVRDRTTGIWLAVLWGVVPNAVVQTTAYSESLLTATAAWSLHAALTSRWIRSGSLAVLAGLSRPNGFAVALAVICAAALTLWREPASRRDWRVWTAPAVAPLGYLGYLAWVGFDTGAPLGYFRVQRGWGSRFDFGRSALEFASEKLVPGSVGLSYFVAAAVVVAAVAGLLCLLRSRPCPPLVVYSIAITVVAIGGSHYFAVKPRLLMPAFPLLLPAAIAAAGARLRVSVPVTGVFAAFSVAYGVYLLMWASTAP
ncbi:hypothetical protein [Streptomyces sp. WMMB 322]|uniref:hypothetical protein n=1 Tax=Streptomyces sp. WMMB 322 TaxID=1286821 RepID=UPI0006E205B3|nr:hypothetical protein [Streptomyces sp. WMMB 322]SCK30712.1 hypothetical protein H180DRAFT_02409 [Streptomyces sp. WMMB 322]